jgi:hypothetical protein
MRLLTLRLITLMLFTLLAGQAFADTWTVTRLRGQVVQFVDGTWQPLTRDGSVPNDRVVKTLGNGRLSLVRGDETIELGPNTQIQIHDKSGAKPFTTVRQFFGTVSIEAEVRNVQHFAVRNQYLAAVVKGTRFTVTAGTSGASVTVQRGQVEVEGVADHSTILIAAGQQARVQSGGNLSVSGRGRLPQIVSKGAKPAADKVAKPQASVQSATGGRAKVKAAGNPKAVEAAEKALEKAAERAAHDHAKVERNASPGDNDSDKGRSDEDGKPGKGKGPDGPTGKSDDGKPEKNDDKGAKGTTENFGISDDKPKKAKG